MLDGFGLDRVSSVFRDYYTGLGFRALRFLWSRREELVGLVVPSFLHLEVLDACSDCSSQRRSAAIP